MQHTEKPLFREKKMRFELTSRHREFFFQHHFIELSEVVSPKDCAAMQAICDAALLERLETPEKASEEELLLAGRDLFRSNEEIKRFALKRQFAELFSQISHKKPLRLIYTQYLRTFDKPAQKQLPFLHSAHTFEESGAFQGIYGAITITFSTSIAPKEELSVQDDVTLVCPTATEKGSAVLVHASSPLCYTPLFTSPNEAHFMIVYGEPNAIYRKSEEDPMTHFPKTLGYSFGDVLKEDLNPTVYR